MEPQHPANPPGDWPDQSAAKDADAPITPTMTGPPESEVQAFENDNFTWQGQSEQLNIDGQDAVPVHSHDEDILDHEV
jgi:hypothetical protein